MGLKTEMEGGCVHALGFCVDESNVHPKAAEHLQHDAAYAHALAAAIKEFRAAPLDTSLTFPSDAVDWLEWRAAELMHEWGFEEKVTP